MLGTKVLLICKNYPEKLILKPHLITAVETIEALAELMMS
jgi:hypothetical protein